MNVGPVFPRIDHSNLVGGLGIGKSDNVSTERRRPSVEQGQSVNLQPDIKIELGTINGKRLYIKLTPTGGWGWSGSPGFAPGATGEDRARVPQAVIEAGRLAHSFTREESALGERLVRAIGALYNVARGQLTPDQFNEQMAQYSVSAADITDALGRLGIDTGRPFYFNGRLLRVRNGVLGYT